MELVDGESLGTRLEREGALAEDEAVSIALDVTAGLGAAHAAGVVHRDLKPDNVVLSADGRAVVTDFGIARAREREGGVSTYGMVGTPVYMAPEQVEGALEIDGRADLYALGEVLYEMLTGRRAWPAKAPLMAAAARLMSPPPDPRALRPSVSAELAVLVLRLLARRPEDRLARAEDVAEALAATRSKVRATPPAAVPPAPPAKLGGGKTVAVLPPRTLGVDEVVADGLLEDLVDTLSMTRGLRVCSSGVSLRYKGAAVDPREAGRALGVQVVVETSIRAVGEALRVTARLVGVDDGFLLWSRRFDRPAGELLQIGDEVVRSVAGALTADLDAPPRSVPEGSAAADLYLRARGDMRGAWHARERMARVAARFDEALALNGRDPHVVAGAALAHARVAYFGGPEAVAHAEAGRDLAERAIALAPQLAEGWIALATLRRDVADDVGAVRALGSALRLSPHSASVREMLGRLVLDAGAVAEGTALLGGALELDPSNQEPRWDLARGHALGGSFAEAFRLLSAPVTSEAEETMRDYLSARLALWMPRGTAPALPEPVAHEGVVPDVTALLRRALTERVFTDAGRAYLEGIATAGRPRISALALQITAELELAVDGASLDRALAAVARAEAAGLFDLAWMDGCPLLAPLRSLPAVAPLRDAVAARAHRVRAAREDGAAGAA
jgi:serine/threonine-protein kinase